VIRLVALEDHIPTFETREDALRALGRGAW
jgi:hypothetical protein